MQQYFDIDNDGRRFGRILSDTLSVQGNVSDWLTQEDYNPSPDELEVEIDYDSSQFRELVSRTSAYSWLLDFMRRKLDLLSHEGDILNSIRNEINRSFPPAHGNSARRQPDEVTSLFRVNWNLAAFIVEQEYSGDNIVAMEDAITLTGSLTNAQALSCLQYLRQTWPLSGEHTFRLLQQLMRTKHGEFSRSVNSCS